MPANNSLRLDEDQRLFPSWPEPLQCYPKQLVGSRTSRLRVPLFQNGELLPPSKIFEEQIAARTTGSKSLNEQEFQQAQHTTDSTWRQAA